MKNILFVFCFVLQYGYAQNIQKITSYKKKTKPIFSQTLSDSLVETSGLVFYDSLYWTHNDDHDTTLYGLDSLGIIRKKVKLKNVVNHDWEEITQDKSFIYIGDFGNNYKGNRTDLNILKISKKSFYTEKPEVTSITFSYENQTDFLPQKSNKTNFDCEAFLVKTDSIYLFTKQWKDQKTTLFVLPNLAGKQVAKQKETFNSKGLITGATFLTNKNGILICGYSKKGKSFLYLLTDYPKNDFLSGKKKRIKLKLPFHQIESITSQDGIHFYITNERLVRKPIINVPPQIHLINLSFIMNNSI